MTSDEPIAAYRERLAQVSRLLELYPDRVEIQARWLFGQRYRMTVKLENLAAQPKRFSVRQRMFKRAMGIGLLAAAAAVVFTRQGYQIPQVIVWALYGIAVVAGGFVMMSWPKVPFVRFLTRQGRPGLDIAQSGPDARGFEDFVEAVQRRIRKQ